MTSNPTIVVVGAGIVGMASAVELQRRRPDARVVVIDKEAGPGRHQSSHNSGVVHSGIYYAPGSAKAVLVRRGRALIESFCRAHQLPWVETGKVIVAATAAELERLDALERRAGENEIEVHRIGARSLGRIEPHVSGRSALVVPSAAITDYATVVEALSESLARLGGELMLNAPLESVQRTAPGLRLGTGAGDLEASLLVNCAGLHSDRVAAMAGATPDVSIVPFRGEYHELTPSARGLVNGLVYPVPDPRWPFLGVHFTTMVDGSVHVGPNAVLAGGRESYRRRLVPADALAMATDPGLRRLAARYWRTGLDELVRSRSKHRLLHDVQALIPAVTADDLVPSSNGVRAQAVSRDGVLLDDFAFASSPNAVHVLNAPSPAATASLAIAEVVADRAESTLS